MSIRSDVDGRRLDQRVLLHRKVETQDAIGDLVVTWQNLIPRGTPAGVDAEKANSERGSSDGIQAWRLYTFWIRADVYARFRLRLVDRIIWRGEPYNISAAPDQQLGGRLIAIQASTGLNDG